VQSSSEKTCMIDHQIAVSGWNVRARWVGLLLLAVTMVCTQSASAQAPAVVVSSQVTLTGSGIGAGRVVVDACGDLYINQDTAGIVEVQAGTGKQIVIAADSLPYNNGTGIAIDSSKTHLYFPDPSQWYTSSFSVVPITNCIPGGETAFATNFGPLTNYYYGTGSNIAVDAAGDVFFTDTCDHCTAILEESAGGNPSVVQASWPNSITSLASDANGNLFFTDGSANVYELKAPYSTAATAVTAAFKAPVGVSFDALGNLYVADSGNSMVYEVPLESGSLNPAHTFQVVAVSVVNNVAVDASGNLYLSNYAGAPVEEKIGTTAIPSVAVGGSGTTTVNYLFNAAVTLAKITATSGSATSTQFSVASGGCAAGTAYTAGSGCSLAVNFAPSQVGLQRGAIVFSDASGNAIATTAISGVGLGSQLTTDPGITTAIGGGFKMPERATVDAAGNVYVTDTTANTVTEFAAGSGTGVVVGTGTVKLSGPTGVAVDGAGNVFISDTGNNRIVEIPVVNGILAGANAVLLTGGLKAPQGIAIDGSGGLYIADSGNNRLLYVPFEGASYNLGAGQLFGMGLNAPEAVTIDATGNVYVADTGNNQVLEFPAPIGSQSQLKVVQGLSAPSALATDASGSLFVVDSGSASIYRYPTQGGAFGSRQLISSSVVAPFGLAIDGLGNLYVTDPTNAAFSKVARVQTALNFGVVNVTATGPALQANLNSSGNQPLVFPSPSYTVSGSTTAGFSVTSDGCGAAGTVAAGTSCVIAASFTPPVPELNAEEDLTLKSNAVSGTPTIALIGTGAHITSSTLTLVLTSPASGTALAVGVPVSFKATVGTGTNSATPGGSVTFSINGTQVGTVKVTNSAASLSLANGLPAGTPDTITAVYSGDSINYSGSSASLTENVTPLPTTLMLAVTTPFTNPNSIADSSANSTGPAIPLIATLGTGSQIIPGGTVSFYSGTSASHTLLGIGSVIAVTGGVYRATITTTALRAGTTNVVENNSFLSNYSIYAVYSGDSSYGASTSNAVPLTVVAPPICAVTGTCTIPNTSTPFPLTGANFAVTPNNPTITVASGQNSGSTILTLVSYGGYNGVMNFTCSNLPQYATCAPYLGDPVVNPSTPNTPAAQSQVQFIINTNVPPIVPTGSSLLWWMAGFTGGILLVLRRRMRGGLESLTLGVGMLMLLGCSVMGVSGCGSSSSSSAFVTPKGTTNVLVTVHAAQFVANTTTNAVIGNDVNTGSFQIALTVQ
jgi:trimeric autotransporter adhesin